MKKSESCFACGDKGSDMFGYTICDSCKSSLGLFTDETIKKHLATFKNSSKKRSYPEEIQYRLDYIEKDYVKKKLKLLHIQSRLEELQ